MRALWSVMLVVACGSSLGAEEVRLKNGDVVYGEILSMDAKSLKLKSDNFGELTVDRDRVATIRFAEPGPQGLWRAAAAAGPQYYAPSVPVYSSPATYTPATSYHPPATLRPAETPSYNSQPSITIPPTSLPAANPSSPAKPAADPKDSLSEAIRALKAKLMELNRAVQVMGPGRDLERLSRQRDEMLQRLLQLTGEENPDEPLPKEPAVDPTAAPKLNPPPR